jgi:hypothetical protein
MKQKKIAPVKPFVAVVTGYDHIFDEIRKQLEKVLGIVDCKAGPFDFSRFTSYYEDQMGRSLLKIFFSFEKLINPGELVRFKSLAVSMEQEYQKAGYKVTRPVNIDPGYISLGKVILSSFKDHAHRIYLQEDIFAEITLVYKRKKGSFLPFEYTYPDYKTPESISFFNEARKIYYEQLKLEQFTLALFDDISS